MGCCVSSHIDVNHCDCYQCKTTVVKPLHLLHSEHVLLVEAMHRYNMDYNALLTYVNTQKNRNGNRLLCGIYLVNNDLQSMWSDS